MSGVQHRIYSDLHWDVAHAGRYTKSTGSIGALSGGTYVHGLTGRLFRASSDTAKGSSVDLSQDPELGTGDWLPVDEHRGLMVALYEDGEIRHLDVLGDGQWADWRWNAARAKSEANLGMVYDPSVDATLVDQGSGTGDGVFERVVVDGRICYEWFHDSVDDDYSRAVNAAVAAGHLRLRSLNQPGIQNFRTAIPLVEFFDIELKSGSTSGSDEVRNNVPSAQGGMFTVSGIVRFVKINIHKLRNNRDAPVIDLGGGGNQLEAPKINCMTWIRSNTALAEVSNFIRGRGGSLMVAKIHIRRVDGSVVRDWAPAIDVETSALGWWMRDNDIVIDRLFGGSLQKAIRMVYTLATGGTSRSYNTNNTIKVKSAEKCAGGVIEITGNQKSDIDISSYDVGTMVANAVEMDQATGGFENRHCTVRYNRQAGTIGAFSDLSLGNSVKTIMEVGGHNTGASQMVVDCAGSNCFAYDLDNVVFNNSANLSLL